MQGTSSKVVSDSLGHALVRAFRLVNRASNRAFAPLELSAEQGHILLVLFREGPMKVGALQKLLALGSGTLTGALDRMDKAGLVNRVADAVDRRAFRVEPAKIAAKKKEKLEAAAERMEREAFHVLSAAERKELLRLLQKLADGFTDDPQATAS